MRFPFIGGAYQSRSSNVNAQRCVNLYPEVDQTGKNILALYGTPGMRRLVTVGSGPIRGMHVANGDLYVVSGDRLYKVNTAWSATSIGTIQGAADVSMAANRTELMVVNGIKGWVVTLSSGAMAEVTDPDFPDSPDQVDVLDDYFIVNSSGSDQFYIASAGASWDGTDFASAEGNPDDVVAVLVDHRELWLFGEKTTEVWYNSGDADFPFARINGAYIETGCVAKRSPAKSGNSVFWLGQDEGGDGIAFAANGYAPTRISTHSIETEFASYASISDAIGFAYQQEGHTFYVLSFPNANKTWAVDIANGLWHERAYMQPGSGALGRHRAQHHAHFNRTHVVGDYQNGKLYALDLDVYTDDGDAIKALRSCAAVWDGNDRMKVAHHRLEIDLEAGVGLNTGQGSDPQMALRWSDDGGHTWSHEHWTTIGAMGKYGARAIWRRLGASRNRIYEASMTDPVKRVLINGHLRASIGNS